MLQARQNGTELLVGIHSDEAILEHKGPTVMNLEERSVLFRMGFVIPTDDNKVLLQSRPAVGLPNQSHILPTLQKFRGSATTAAGTSFMGMI